MSGSPGESSGTTPGRLSTAHAAALAAAGVLVVVTFLPWQRTDFSGSVTGIDSGGWVTLVLGLVAGWRLWVLRGGGGVPRDSLIAAAAGVLATIVTVYLLIFFLTDKEGLLQEVRMRTPLAGIYIALGASVVLTAASLAIRRKD